MEHITISKIVEPKLQSKINESIIFNYLYSKKFSTRAEISKKLKISAPAVSRAINNLLDQNYILEKEKIKTKVGKRPIELIINPDKEYAIGVYLGGDRIKVALCNYKCDIIKNNIGVKIRNNISIVDDVIKEIKKILLYKNKIKAICIGVPEVVDIRSGSIIADSLYSNWRGINFKEILSNEFKTRVIIDKNVNLCVLGEKFFGGAKDYENFVFIEIGKGIGLGIFVNNKLYRGYDNYAGGISFMLMNANNFDSSSNYRGNLEETISIESFREEIRKEMQKGGKIIKESVFQDDSEEINYEKIFKAAINGDMLSRKFIKRMVHNLSLCFLNISLILNPQSIIIGGDFIKLPFLEELIIDPIYQNIKNAIPLKIPSLKRSSLDGNAGIKGALYMAIRTIITNRFPYNIE